MPNNYIPQAATPNSPSPNSSIPRTFPRELMGEDSTQQGNNKTLRNSSGVAPVPFTGSNSDLASRKKQVSAQGDSGGGAAMKRRKYGSRSGGRMEKAPLVGIFSPKDRQQESR